MGDSMRRREEIRSIITSNPDREMREQKAKYSARNEPLAGSTLGAASEGRRLTAEEFEKRKAELMKGQNNG